MIIKANKTKKLKKVTSKRDCTVKSKSRIIEKAMLFVMVSASLTLAAQAIMHFTAEHQPIFAGTYIKTTEDQENNPVIVYKDSVTGEEYESDLLLSPELLEAVMNDRLVFVEVKDIYVTSLSKDYQEGYVFDAKLNKWTKSGMQKDYVYKDSCTGKIFELQRDISEIISPKSQNTKKLK